MEWFVLAWDAFRAPQFPYDEALRLAREIVGRVAVKKTSDVILLEKLRLLAFTEQVQRPRQLELWED